MKDELFNQLMESVTQADEIIQGKMNSQQVTNFEEPIVKAIRAKTGLTQSRFADAIGVSKRTLENWEQGRRHPTGSARALLRILEADPKSVALLKSQFLSKA
ncbi:NadS family protein [Beggiatoa leptomitoformis]|uniref:Helix-turn-helix domain-containing protein n=1 Tax=Beggiatoa leptomitoformis TaxID=288004 RepID=A0A2N9YCU8_9GAMM|nr:NadS family protein [Beggiatoa leptomitoformis]ALG66453.1 helix-turn-helix domain-containing protein [Beggiatoa leptomitoformis]AUI68266.1 helix-turn-helix domain-containing protein [Beggiatoa leptomitoformis]